MSVILFLRSLLMKRRKVELDKGGETGTNNFMFLFLGQRFEMIIGWGKRIV